MNTTTQNQINTVIANLFLDSKLDYLRMIKGATKGIFRPLQPADLKDVYLSISKEQGEDLVKLIKQMDLKSIVEFGTSFGVSTLYLAQGALETNGRIITTELIESKAQKAAQHFKQAQVDSIIDLRVGDAMKTLANHSEPIDLLLLDGWKDLYLPLFRMLESNFHETTIVYVDNADMSEVVQFLHQVHQGGDYYVEYKYGGKAALVRKK